MFALRSSTLRTASTVQRCAILPAVVTPPVRSLYKKAVQPPKHFTKAEIDEKVLELLFDYTKVAQDKVNLESNIIKDLSIGRLDRFGLYWDLQTEFEFMFLPARSRTRELASGREAADWVASILEEEQRLKA
ncbi:hypothetical protein PhCBS80983_g05723 [Powellomyces hirtus]|uniref:Uncharacterized protein n=1 Tax=Powellomyces hirtus TaxID=109895 RepID=A0A507DTM7_9FUNG|nr:hypothetical protein PhCBS80983_g05723 [Powellomyces hirtus]